MFDHLSYFPLPALAKLALALSLIVSGPAIFCQSQAPPGAVQGGSTAATGAAPAVRILSPGAGSKVEQNVVSIRWELANPGASADSSPNFQVQLDGRDPVNTNSMDYTFTGVNEGEHVVVVQLVDANQLPITGGRAEVRFTAKATSSTANHTGAVLATPQKPEPVKRDSNGRELPPASGALPLISIIGFGALLGGVVSALKTT
jgi:hypothetical protein